MFTKFIMKFTIKILFIYCFSMFANNIFSQDIHFSQFINSPLTLNPAKTGDYLGNWRFMNNYRRQWGSFTTPSSPFRTISVGIDKPFDVKKNSIGLGLIVINDQSSDAQLTVNKFYGSIAYHKKIKKSFLRIGVQGGYVIKNYSKGKLTFPNQFDNTSGLFNSGITSGENSLSEDISYPDVNAGLVWNLQKPRFQPEIGISLFHINQPSESYTGKGNNLPMRQVIHGSGKYLLSKKIFVQPSFLIMNHAQASDVLFGTHAGYIIPNEGSKIKYIYTGVYFRDGFKSNYDSFIGLIGINLYNFDIGFSYDFNVSELKSVTNYKGGFEISIIYISPKLKLNQISIPCDRY